MEAVAVIDFETTGLSPDQGDRATEIALVIVDGGQIVDRYQSLMNAGVRIPPFIEDLTGITNAMLQSAPAAETVMREAASFVGDLPLVAHNAAFDSKFWAAEQARINAPGAPDFACSLLLSRRLLPHAPSHKLGALAEYAGLPPTGRAHRALADAEMAAGLLLHIANTLRQQHGIPRVTHALLRTLQRTPKAKLAQCLASYR